MSQGRIGYGKISGCYRQEKEATEWRVLGGDVRPALHSLEHLDSSVASLECLNHGQSPHAKYSSHGHTLYARYVVVRVCPESGSNALVLNPSSTNVPNLERKICAG